MTGWRQWEIKTIERKDWSDNLLRVRPEVKQLYCRGEWNKKFFRRAVAVVGSRRMTQYGEVMTRKIVTGLVEAGYTIVSGFMYGVDTAAHKTCLENKGRTAAVLGSGLNCLTPAENDNLYTQILAGGGAVVSEFEPEQEAKLWTFPYRNRIVAGLSRAIVVVEAGEKSGSLVTAKWAKKQGKPVLAVPGPATSSAAAGTNWLIKNGAELVTDANDVLTFFGEFNRVKKEERFLPVLSGDGRRIVELLTRESLDCDGICRQLNWSPEKTGIILSQLSLQGVIEERGDKWINVDK